MQQNAGQGSSMLNMCAVPDLRNIRALRDTLRAEVEADTAATCLIIDDLSTLVASHGSQQVGLQRFCVIATSLLAITATERHAWPPPSHQVAGLLQELVALPLVSSCAAALHLDRHPAHDTAYLENMSACQLQLLPAPNTAVTSSRGEHSAHGLLRVQLLRKTGRPPSYELVSDAKLKVQPASVAQRGTLPVAFTTICICVKMGGMWRWDACLYSAVRAGRVFVEEQHYRVGEAGLQLSAIPQPLTAQQLASAAIEKSLNSKKVRRHSSPTLSNWLKCLTLDAMPDTGCRFGCCNDSQRLAMHCDCDHRRRMHWRRSL
jgi:hypothetical protein